MEQQVRRLYSVLMCAVVLAAFPVLADEIVFPDPALDAAIRETLGLGTGPILSEDLEHLTSLLAGARGIIDLTGMEACIRLEQLHLHSNQIADLTPLAGLQTLKNVSLNGNNIIDISPLATLPLLMSLAIHGNQIADIRPIASLPVLASLSIGNAIDNIKPLADLPSLVRLMIYIRPTTDLSPLQQMQNLEFLLVSTGQPISGRILFDPTLLTSCSELTSLQLHGYNIARIADLANALPLLTKLELRYVGIDDLSMFHMFDALTSLTLYGVAPCSEGANLSRLNVPAGVTTLSLENNGLDDVAVIANCTWLASLNLARNEITDIEALEGVKNPAASCGALKGRSLQIQAELIFMLQFDVMPSQFRENVAHRLRRYIHLFVTSEPVPDVTGFIPGIAHIARTNNKPIRLRRISAFLPPASCGVSSGGLL